MKQMMVAALILVGSQVAFGWGSTPTSDNHHERFKIVINPQVRADTFLLDSETGQIWQKVCVLGSKDPMHCDTFWERQAVEGLSRN